MQKCGDLVCRLRPRLEDRVLYEDGQTGRGCERWRWKKVPESDFKRSLSFSQPLKYNQAAFAKKKKKKKRAVGRAIS